MRVGRIGECANPTCGQPVYYDRAPGAGGTMWQHRDPTSPARPHLCADGSNTNAFWPPRDIRPAR